jgi:phenylpropionate dioxygenase-like ring-hydroxylating dioxygenase large terminal subunit
MTTSTDHMPDYWYPVYPAAKLGAKPVGVCLLGELVVLWRSSGTHMVAFEDLMHSSRKLFHSDG